MAGPPKGYGIIPADAGSTDTPFFVRFSARDHPRGCGEHIERHLGFDRNGGSSPRMRGAPLPFGRGVDDIGIIPADAGSTPRSGAP